MNQACAFQLNTRTDDMLVVSSNLSTGKRETAFSLFLSARVSIQPTPAVDAPAGNVQFKGLSRTSRMKLKWTHVGLVFFILVSLVMTGCFFWQYQLPKLLPGESEADSQAQPHPLLSLQRKHLILGSVRKLSGISENAALHHINGTFGLNMLAL